MALGFVGRLLRKEVSVRGAVQMSTHSFIEEEQMSRVKISLRRLVLSGAVAAALSVAVAGPAAAHAPCAETFDRPGASDFGRDHIAGHGPHGRGIEGAHNPGTHQGYSLCNPSGR